MSLLNEARQLLSQGTPKGNGLAVLTKYQLKDGLLGSMLPSQLLQQLAPRAQGGEGCPDDFTYPQSKSLYTWQNHTRKGHRTAFDGARIKMFMPPQDPG